MLDFHKEKKADATIAVMDVPIDVASSFGIMNTNDDWSIYEFEEKRLSLTQFHQITWSIWWQLNAHNSSADTPQYFIPFSIIK